MKKLKFITSIILVVMLLLSQNCIYADENSTNGKTIHNTSITAYYSHDKNPLSVSSIYFQIRDDTSVTIDNNLFVDKIGTTKNLRYLQ